MSTINADKLEKMSVAEREAVKQQVDVMQEQLNNPDKLSDAGQNGTSEMKADIQRKKELLEKDDQLRAKGAEKDQIVRRMKEIESVIIPAMPTKNEMWAKPGTQESDKAVQKNKRFHSLHGHLAREWQVLAKRLEPDDPWAQSLETIRPDK